MSLTNSQYNSIMRQYDERRAKARADLSARTEEVYRAVPAIKELDSGCGGTALERYRRYMTSSDETELENLKGDLKEIGDRRKQLLTAAGFPGDYLKMRYVCPECKDTGYIDGRKCRCFKAAQTRILYAQSRLEEILKKENFDQLTYDYYDKINIIGAVNRTQYEYMSKVIDFCRDFAEHFGEKGGNLLFTGNTGTGKTFLTNCIADRLIDNCYSVIYLSAIELFDVMIGARMGRWDSTELNELHDRVMDCDLLIIDDLGSEHTNSMDISELFNILNTRLLEGRSVIISTNLSMNALRDTYTERITSRIQRSFDIIPVYGDDIRVRMK